MRLTSTIVLALFLSFNVNAQRIVKNKVTDYDANSSMVSYLSSTGEVSEVEVDLRYVKNDIWIYQLFDRDTGEKYYSIIEKGITFDKYAVDLSDYELGYFNQNMPDSDTIKTLLNGCNRWLAHNLKNPSSFKPVRYDISKRHRDNGKKLYTIKVNYIATNGYGAEIESEESFEFNDKLKITAGWILSKSTNELLKSGVF